MTCDAEGSFSRTKHIFSSVSPYDKPFLSNDAILWTVYQTTAKLFMIVVPIECVWGQFEIFSGKKNKI